MIVLLAPYGVLMTEATAWSVLMYSGPLVCALIGLTLEAEHFWLSRKGHRSIDVVDRQVAAHNNKDTRGESDEDKSG